MRDWILSGAAVRDRCDDLEISLLEMSRRAGVSYSHVKRLLAGQAQPYDYTARKLTRALECRIEDIATPKPDTAAGSAA